MVSKLLLTGMLATTLAAALLAQGRGGGGSSGGGGESEYPSTRLGEFASRLKLDMKTQYPAVVQIFADAATDAAPIAQEMIQLRQKLVNLELTNKTDEMPPVHEAYIAAATKMAGIEALVFDKVYTVLQPYQRSKAADAFTFMAGFFQTAAGRSGRAGRRGGA